MNVDRYFEPFFSFGVFPGNILRQLYYSLFYRLLDDCEQGLIVANEKTKELRMEARQTAQCTNKIGILTAFAFYSHI